MNKLGTLEEFLESINWSLAKERGLSDDQIDDLRKVYIELWSLATRPKMYSKNGADAVGQMHSLEYILQMMWGFGRDVNYHRYHFDIKGCTCPYLDNMELIGVDMMIVSANCPFHGDTKYEPWK